MLTVDDNEGLLAGVVNLQKSDDKLTININLKLAEKTGFKMSARLLKLANIIKESP